MKNQINVGDQDPIQIRYNSINHSTCIPERPKINYWIVTAILLFYVFLVVGSWFIWYVNNKDKISSSSLPSIAKQTSQITITGVIRTSGLSDEEKQKFGLTMVNYQITDFGDYQKTYKEEQIMGYFLLSNNANDELLGKCVRVTGNVPEEWKKINPNAFGRSVLSVAKIEEIDNSYCNPYSQVQLDIDNTKEKIVRRGSVIHANRLAPDMGYDYVLKLVDSSYSFSEVPPGADLVYIKPTTNNLWNELENNINEEITIEGYWAWGYAETGYIQVVSIKGSSNTEEVEIKSLITKFEKYIQDRNVPGLMALFTSAKTKEDIASYRNLMGQDPDVGSPRLFNNDTSNFIITNWEIARREYPDNKLGILAGKKELITKDNNRYFVVVEETRKSWCNVDPCAGTYSFENKRFYVIEIVKQNSYWMVDRYFPQQASSKMIVTKYEALHF